MAESLPIDSPATTQPLPAQQPLLPKRHAQGRALIIVLSVMAALAGLSLLFARGAIRLDHDWSAQLSRTSTVQVLVASEALREAQMERARAILERAVPDGTVTVQSRDDSLALIRPWLGNTQLPDDLPIPGVITVSAEARLPVESLTRQFEEAGLRVSVDDHSRFSGRLAQTVDRLVLFGLGLVGLTFIATTAVNVFATRADLAAQRDIIHVLVQAGASDRFVARLFIGRAARHGLSGGLIGSVGALALWVYISFGPGRGTLGWPSFPAIFPDLIWLAGLVILFAIICATAAGWAAHRQLAFERRRA